MPQKECSHKFNRFTHRKCKTVYVAIGSNLGDRETNCLDAVGRIDEIDGVLVTRVSEWYEFEALTLKPEETQPDFINGAIEIETTLSPHELLSKLQAVEVEMGRPKDHKPWAPRTIDLDILLYSDLIGSDEVLTLPHPEIAKRPFVLKPLCDIAADVIHPVLKKTMKAVHGELACPEQCRRVEP